MADKAFYFARVELGELREAWCKFLVVRLHSREPGEIYVNRIGALRMSDDATVGFRN